jgi:hypothetical protein
VINTNHVNCPENAADIGRATRCMNAHQVRGALDGRKEAMNGNVRSTKLGTDPMILTARADSNDSGQLTTAPHRPAQAPAGHGRCWTVGHRFGSEGPWVQIPPPRQGKTGLRKIGVKLREDVFSDQGVMGDRSCRLLRGTLAAGSS